MDLFLLLGADMATERLLLLGFSRDSAAAAQEAKSRAAAEDCHTSLAVKMDDDFGPNMKSWFMVLGMDSDEADETILGIARDIGDMIREQQPNRKPVKLVHRDDVPMQLTEQVVAHMQEQFPGYKVRFAGDYPEGELPPEIIAAHAELEELFGRSLASGMCVRCKATISGYPNGSKTISESSAPRGWKLFRDMSGQPEFWECPDHGSDDDGDD
jgi:hypothetical protein